MENAPKAPFLFGEFELDVAGRVLRKNGEIVRLHARAFDLLAELVENRDRFVSKNELLEKVWEGQFVEENNLTVQIAALRKIFGDKKGRHRFIATIPGKGYKFIHEIIEPEGSAIVIENRTIERIFIEDESEPAPMLIGPKPRRYIVAAAAALVLIAAGIGVWAVFVRKTPAPIESIAVMPFVYEGDDRDGQYLSEGMAESLINELSRIPQISVRARASAFRYQGKEIDARKVGRELEVEALLFGRITERGDELIISIELVETSSEKHLWGERYTRKKNDLAGVRTDIGRDVSLNLGRRLAPSDLAAKGQTADSEAYRLYLRGRYLWNKRRHDDHLKALELYRQAIAADPQFALAWAAIGDVYIVDSFKMPVAERVANARSAAQNALRIEPDLAEAIAILGKADRDQYEWPAAELNFKKAIALNPNYPTARQWYSSFLIQNSRFDEGIAEMNRALALDPLSPIINSEAAWMFFMARRYDDALTQVTRTLELESNEQSALWCRQAVYEVTGNIPAALDVHLKLAELAGDPPHVQEKRRADVERLRKEFAEKGERAFWRLNLEYVKARQATEEVEPFVLAFASAKAGDYDRAIVALEKSFAANSVDVRTLNVDPGLDELRSDPRFRELLKRLNF